MPDRRDRPQLHADFLRWVEQLGKAFVAKGLSSEAASLRVYYWALNHGHTGLGRDMHVVWSPDAVREWMKVLQVPPWEGHYQVLPMNAPQCPGCRRPRSLAHVELTAGPVRKVKCRACKEIWVEEAVKNVH